MLGCEGIVAHGRLAISAAPCLAKLSIRRQEGRGFRVCASLFCLLRQPRQPQLGHRSAGNVVQYSYDAANQLINGVEVNSPNTNANTTLYGYDTNGDPDVPGTDQEMVEDQLAWDRDPLGGGPGGNSDVVHVSDQQAQAFEEALDSKVGPPYPDCPSCGDPYHNGPLGSPWLHLHGQMFTAFNSNTFTWNVVANFLKVTPPDIGNNAPGYHYSPGYAGYP